jgi:hypothetical protein
MLFGHQDCPSSGRRQSSPNRPPLTRGVANGSELDRQTSPSRSFATSHYTPSGFRFRRLEAWGFKSLLVH